MRAGSIGDVVNRLLHKIARVLVEETQITGTVETQALEGRSRLPQPYGQRKVSPD